MRRIELVAGLFLALAALALLAPACGGAEPTATPTEVAMVPTSTSLPTATSRPTDTPLPPTDTPTTVPSPTDTPLPPSPTNTPLPPTHTPTTAPSPTAATVASAENCIGCHTDQETLQELAVAQEVKSEASSGEG